MRVLMVTGSFPPDRCGVGDYTARLCEALARRVELGVLTSSHGCRVGDDPPYVMRAMPAWDLADLGHFDRAVRRFEPDVVHVQFPTQGYRGGKLAWLTPALVRALGARVVQTWHEPISRRGALKLLAQTLAGGPVVVVRPDYRELLHPWLRAIVRRKQLRYVNSASTLPRCTLSPSELASLRVRWLDGRRRLIVFFGFVYPHKRVEQVFEIADPATDRVVIAGELTDDAYGRRIRQLAAASPWSGRASIAGFLPADEVTALLAVADAVVLPFQLGGGDWNTSIHAATREGAFVVTTSRTIAGFDAARNVHFARPDDVADMRRALAAHAGRRGDARSMRDDAWGAIADAHLSIYNESIKGAA
jgi:glycosyltransferase involved in cell wall biosynthesis